ncbi:MAG: hypothetical protein J5861_04450 [Desulfovibrio sp.]|nr:hypothetical protein [Desulfovibrio sp.]
MTWSLEAARDDILKTEEQCEAEARVCDVRRQYLRHLADVAHSPEGSAVLSCLLWDLGVIGECPEDVRLIALRNFGERLFNDIYNAAPRTATQIMATLRARHGGSPWQS